MNLASKNVFILCYRASKIVQSFMEEFAQKRFREVVLKANRILETNFTQVFFRVFLCSRFAVVSLLQ